MKGEIHIKSSHVSMTGFVYREGFISRVHMYLGRDSRPGRDSDEQLTCMYQGIIKGLHIDLWRDSYIGRNSYKDFTCIYGDIQVQGGIHIRSSHISMEGLIKGVHIYLWRNLSVGSDSNKELICIDGVIHITSSHISIGGFL